MEDKKLLNEEKKNIAGLDNMLSEKDLQAVSGGTRSLKRDYEGALENYTNTQTEQSIIRYYKDGS